jgi:hypothetical protein
VATVSLSSWTEAFADSSGARFGDLVTSAVVLEGSVFVEPIVGRTAVWRTLRHSASIYDQLKFTLETASDRRVYLEWEGEAGGLPLAGLTALTLDDEGRVLKVAIHHRPLAAVKRFASRLSDSTEQKEVT